MNPEPYIPLSKSFIRGCSIVRVSLDRLRIVLDEVAKYAASGRSEKAATKRQD